MNQVYEQVNAFLENTESSLEEFCDSEVIIWIDWREYDEDIIRYFNDMMEDRLEIQMLDNGKQYGEDIVIIKHQEKLQIPYEEKMDRDTTIRYLNDFIKPKYDIRWFVESLGNDTLGFVLMRHDEWQMLEETFGQSKLGYFFSPIGLTSKMFDLTMDEVSSLMNFRDKNQHIDFLVIADWVTIVTQEKQLKTQKNDGDIDLKCYLESVKKIKQLKADFTAKYPEFNVD